MRQAWHEVPHLYGDYIQGLVKWASSYGLSDWCCLKMESTKCSLFIIILFNHIHLIMQYDQTRIIELDDWIDESILNFSYEFIKPNSRIRNGFCVCRIVIVGLPLAKGFTLSFDNFSKISLIIDFTILIFLDQQRCSSPPNI